MAYLAKARPSLVEEKRGIGKLEIGLGVLTLFVGGFLSLYASPLKDGLEHALTQMGWTEQRAAAYRTWFHQAAHKIQDALSFLPDYKWTSLSGILGALLTFLAVTGGLWLLLRGRKKKREEHR